MTPFLTPQQTSLLRRAGEGIGLPAYVLRPRSCARDVELLCLMELVTAKAGDLAITARGAEHLQRIDGPGAETQFDNLRVAHAQDGSISVEYWPQEY